MSLEFVQGPAFERFTCEHNGRHNETEMITVAAANRIDLSFCKAGARLYKFFSNKRPDLA